MNLLQKRIAASTHLIFFIAVFLSVGFRYSLWSAALLCSAFCLAVQILTFACSPKRDLVFFSISCVSGALLAISHFQGEFSFVPDLAVTASLALVYVARLICENRYSRPVWMLAFVFVPMSMLAVWLPVGGHSSFQQNWDIAASTCIVATALMGLIPFGKARMTTEYWVSSAVIACLAAFLAAAVSVNF